MGHYFFDTQYSRLLQNQWGVLDFSSELQIGAFSYPCIGLALIELYKLKAF